MQLTGKGQHLDAVAGRVDFSHRYRQCFQFDTIHVPRQSPFKKIPAVSKLVPLVNACLRPSEDETASDGDSLEAELTAGEESSSNSATLSMDDGASAHSLNQPEEDEDMDDEVLGEGHETPANFSDIYIFAVL